MCRIHVLFTHRTPRRDGLRGSEGARDVFVYIVVTHWTYIGHAGGVIETVYVKYMSDS